VEELVQVLHILAELLEQPMPENELRAAWMIDHAFHDKIITFKEAQHYLAILIQSAALIEESPYWLREVVLLHHQMQVWR